MLTKTNRSTPSKTPQDNFDCSWTLSLHSCAISSLVAMALERTNYMDCGKAYMVVTPKNPSQRNVFKTKTKMLPVLFFILPWGIHSF